MMTPEEKLQQYDDINVFLMNTYLTAKKAGLHTETGKKITAIGSKMAHVNLMILRMIDVKCQCGAEIKTEDQLRFYKQFGNCILCDAKEEERYE